MKITIATLLLVLGFFINTFSQEPDLAKIKAMPDDTLKVARLYAPSVYHITRKDNPCQLDRIAELILIYLKYQ